MRLAPLAGLLAATAMHAADITWKPTAASGDWGVAANWDLGRVPANGDTVIFPATGVRATTNTLSALQLAGLRFQAPGWSIAGNALGVATLVRVDATALPGVGVLAPLVLTDAVEVRVAAGGALGLAGEVQGPGSLRKTGAGRLALTTANSYGGATTVAAGLLYVANDAALGTTAAGTTVDAGAGLVLVARTTPAAGLSIAEPLTLAGSGSGDFGALTAYHDGSDNATATCTGAITLAAGTVRVRALIPTQSPAPLPEPGLTLNLAGAIGGSGRLALECAAPPSSSTSIGIRFSGAAANTWSGGAEFRTGSFALAKTAGTTAVPNGAVHVGGSGLAIVRQQAAHQIGDVAALTLADQGVLVLGGNETIGSLAGSGSIELANAWLDLGGVGDTTFTGAISNDFASPSPGSGVVRKIGDGRFTWNATRSPTRFHSFTILGGQARLDGLLEAGVTVAGGTLTGTATMLGLSGSSGRIEPGGAGTVGTFGCTQLSLSGTVSLAVDVVPGAHDQIVVDGTVALGGRLAPVVLPGAGGTRVIIDNDGVDAVAGAFTNGIPVSTTAGTGNDVGLLGMSGSVGFTAAAASVAEGAAAEFTVTLEGIPAGAVTVQWETVPVTAQAVGDYSATFGTLDFPPGTTSRTISVPVADDLAAETSETFQIRLVATTGGVGIRAPATATVTIPFNDGGSPPIGGGGTPGGAVGGSGGGGCGAGSTTALALLALLAALGFGAARPRSRR